MHWLGPDKKVVSCNWPLYSRSISTLCLPTLNLHWSKVLLQDDCKIYINILWLWSCHITQCFHIQFLTGNSLCAWLVLWEEKNPIKFPCDTQNTLMSAFLKDQMLCTQCPMQMLHSHLLRQDEHEFSFGLQHGMLCNLLLFENWVLANDIIMM